MIFSHKFFVYHGKLINIEINLFKFKLLLMSKLISNFATKMNMKS